MCIGESKAKFFPITVNKYKYQLTIPVNCSKLLKIKYNILLRLYLFLQLKNLNYLASFIILMSCLYYFRWSEKKNRTFDIVFIIKWGGKIVK